MKKYLALTIAILAGMCFTVVFNAQEVESYKLNKDYVHINSKKTVSESSELKTTRIEKTKEVNIKTESSKNQDTIPMSVEEAKAKHTQKALAEATESKGKRKINPQKPMVALTFDDGPHYKYTVEILDCLKKYDGRATFFVLGSKAEKYKNVIRSISENGNEIGNHTYDHKRLTKLSSKELRSEVTKTNNIIKNITNTTPDILRPTYGSVNQNVKLYSGEPLILWSIDTLDWKSKNEKKIENKVLLNVKDGDIILMHDIYKSTAVAAKVIIMELNSRGYQLVTIDELYAARGIDLSNGKVYKCAYKKK